MLSSAEAAQLFQFGRVGLAALRAWTLEGWFRAHVSRVADGLVRKCRGCGSWKEPYRLAVDLGIKERVGVLRGNRLRKGVITLGNVIDTITTTALVRLAARII